MATKKKKKKGKKAGPIGTAASTPGLLNPSGGDVPEKNLGKWEATAYGPPWDAMNGTGTTSQGTDLKSGPKDYIVAIGSDASRFGLKHGDGIRIVPNPFGDSRILFKVDDTCPACTGEKHIDIYDWRGRQSQYRWGSKQVTIIRVGSSFEAVEDKYNGNPLTKLTNGVADAAGDLVPDPVADLVKFVARLFEPEFWLRVGKTLLGVIALVIAAFIFIRAMFGAGRRVVRKGIR